jgi:glycosyltransferase involved in cell wall biosynthesis
MPYLIAIIPAYNEEKIISQVVEEVKSYVDEIIVVNDGSTDQTARLAKEKEAVVLNHLINRGQGAALKTGFEYLKMKILPELRVRNLSEYVIVHFDADGQHQAADIPKIVQPILKKRADIVLGSRFLNQNSKIPFTRKFLLKGAIFVNWFLTGIKLTDAHNGFRALSWEAANLIKISQDRMAHNSEIIKQIVKYKLKFQEVPVTVTYTQYSRLKGQKWWDGFKIIKDFLIGRFL